MEKQENRLQNPWVVCALALLCTFLWGSAVPTVKTGYEWFGIASGDTGSQILFAGYRFTMAGLLTLTISSIQRKKFAVPCRELWGHVLLLGFIQTTVQYVLFYIGLSNTTGVKGAVITASNSLFSILLAHFLVKERMTLRKTAGCVLGFAGVVLINFTAGGLTGGFSFNGEGFLMISCFAYALAAVFIKTFICRDHAFTVTAWQLLSGGMILIILGMLMGGAVHGFTFRNTLLLLYMAVISSTAFSLWTLLLQYNPVGKVSIYGFANPVFGVILSAVILGENAFTLKNLAALFLVSLGIIVVNRQKPCKDMGNHIK